MKESKKILIATASHLSSCPRLIKEAQLLTKHGYKVTVVYLESIPRISILDQSIQKNNPEWEFVSIKWGNTIDNIISKLTYRIFKFFNQQSVYIQSTSRVLINTILNIKADLYIAHHPSVLVAVALAAKLHNAKYSYDIEDAFPYVEDGRYIDNPDNKILEIEKKYLTDTVFTTSASPLYSDLYFNNYDLKSRPLDLLNVFDINTKEINYLDRKDLKKVSLYWYSQTVGLNRGLQDLFNAVNALPINSFELHIRGNCEISVRENLMSLVKVKEHIPNINFHESVSIEELEERNKEHDIGFAIEVNSSLNKDMCISNKIFDYLRSGLMLVATNTRGHQFVINDLQNEAVAYSPGDTITLSNELKKLIDNPERIKSAKIKSLQLAQEKYNWTKQSEQFINKISNELY